MHECIERMNIDKKTNGSVYWGETFATVTVGSVHRLPCSLQRLFSALGPLVLQQVGGGAESK
jgi:hypothetical protein